MSRYEWREDNLIVTIGYDQPMRTFFAQIHNDNLAADEDNCLVWLGGSFDEYPVLAPMLEKFGREVPSELRRQLEADRRGAINQPPPVIHLPSGIKKIC